MIKINIITYHKINSIYECVKYRGITTARKRRGEGGTGKEVQIDGMIL
jgi:hypothetical protein